MKSPIETLLRNALLESVPKGCVYLDSTSDTPLEPRRYMVNGQGPFFDVDFPGDGEWLDRRVRVDMSESGVGRYVFSLYARVRVLAYRLDFLFITTCGLSFAIECDGHEWHDRTTQQATRDRARDRDLLRYGIPTIRFTGSEIVHRAHECASEVFALAKELDDRDRMRDAGDLINETAVALKINRRLYVGNFGLMEGALH